MLAKENPEEASAEAELHEIQRFLDVTQAAGMGTLAKAALKCDLKRAAKKMLSAQPIPVGSEPYQIVYERKIKEQDPDGAIARDYYTQVIPLCTLGIEKIEKERALCLLELPVPEAQEAPLDQEQEQTLRDCLEQSRQETLRELVQIKEEAELALAKMPPLPAKPASSSPSSSLNN